MSLTLYNLSDITDMRKGYSGNMTENPNFDRKTNYLYNIGITNKDIIIRYL